MSRASANQRYVVTFDPRYNHPHAIIDRGPLCLPNEEYPQVLQRFATREDLQFKLNELRELRIKVIQDTKASREDL